MEHITTYMGEDFSPLAPDNNQIHIEDIAHALSLMCRANGHFVHFYSVAQHSINCANEAKARGLSARIQTACLLHDASEAYLSDITRPVKSHLSKYQTIEKCLQDTIYCKFIGSSLTEDETAIVDQIDNDMLICEFNALMKKKVFGDNPKISSTPSFKFRDFAVVENEFVGIFKGEEAKFASNQSNLKTQITMIEHYLHGKDKTGVFKCLTQHNVHILFAEKLYIKQLSAQVDVAIHAFGILLTLSKIMDDGEKIEYLSLGAGNTGKAFDVATSKRIAEFKFAKWDDGSNTIRQNGIFKDFLELAKTPNSGKVKQIYCLSANNVKKFFCNSERSLAGVLSRNSARKKHTDIQDEYGTVKAFYHAYKNEVEIIELSDYINME